METTTAKSGKTISQILATALSFGLFVYFLYHLLHGDRGYFALKGVEEKIQQAQVLHDRTMKERSDLENRVKILRPAGVDEDMLDERARAVLGFVKPDELVILDSEGAAP